MNVVENIQSIQRSIPEEVTLIAVSKTRTLDEMEVAYQCGIRDFGENKVQELISKYEGFHKDVNWHLIGHLQRNKVKYIAGKVALIHSLDSVRLLREIEKQYQNIDMKARVLIQINIGREESKTGALAEELEEIIQQVGECNHVEVVGLMAIIPRGDEEENRKYFRDMKMIFERLKAENHKNVSMEYLSMGMTGDYQIAIEEGSNMIRIGEGIFGRRIYNNNL
ncbi:YggS family pyridoxal phosphate-dependent enzyme [Clostridium thermarum]|uniref:YggS family pyridoxal phosphate-dependent enzyme n=1 Tax=Clostridium thermarum TaxID=1716543 RepID=UPI001122F719|nr:YggS family pyridoxal phosphate-dependent enzyme [Clostridium thermarum]